MEPGVALGLWLLSNAVVPDAYSRVVNTASSRTQLRRLNAEVRHATGLRPGRRYRRWLRTEETWQRLVARRQDAYDDLVSSLAVAEARGLFRGRSENRERARLLVDSTIAFFLPTLDPSTATAVTDSRAERRHAEVMERFDARAGFDEQLGRLPPPAAEILADASTPRGLAERLVDAIVRGTPHQVVPVWTDARPEWLQHAPASILLSLGQIAQAYGLRREAARLFAEAADLGLDPTRWYARAALEASAHGDHQLSADLLAKTRIAGGEANAQVVEAVLANDAPAILRLLDSDAAAADPFSAYIYASALHVRGRDAQIGFLQAVAERFPSYSDLTLLLAQLLLDRSRTAGSVSRDLDREQSLHLALKARDTRRAWRGDSSGAVEVACLAALVSGDLKQVVSLGTLPPAGQALPEEAANPDVQFSVAQAALVLGNQDVVEEVAASSSSALHQALLQAELLARRGAPLAEIGVQYEVAWGLAPNEIDKVNIWMGAAMHGIDPLPGAEELLQRSDDLPVLCLAARHIANGRLDDAITALRPRRESEAARRLLTDAYLRRGDVDAAVSELIDAAQRFANAGHQLRAVEVLVGAGRVDEAAALADRTLPLVPPSHPDRGLLHEVGVVSAYNHKAWPDMETRARAWISELGDGGKRRWLLALAVYNQVDPDRAWRVLTAGDVDLQPGTAIEAQLWILLNARYNASTETLSSILALVDRFPEDTDVRNVAVNAFFLMGDQKGAIDPTELERWHEHIRDRADNPTPGDTFIALTVPDDPDGLVEAFRPFLEEQAEQLNTWLKRLRHETWPIGVLSMVSGRSYTETLALRPTGWLPIAAADRNVLAAELATAESALDSACVIVDLSAVVACSYIRDRWTDFVAAFSTLTVTTASRDDAAIAADDFRPRSPDSLSWDLTVGRPVLHSTPDEVMQRHQEELRWIRATVMSLTPCPAPPEPIEAPHEDPWLTTIAAARIAGLPIWADDLGLRTLARNEGLATFGTDSLLAALLRRGRLTADDVADSLESLREHYCVDLPIDEDWIARAAERDGWLLGPALVAMSRKPLWVRPREAFELWSTIVTAGASADAATVPAWVHAAVIGIQAAHADVAQATQLSAGVLVKAATLIAPHPSVFAQCALAASAAARDAERPDPTEFALEMAFDLFSQRYGVDQAAAAVARLGSELTEEHREALRRILLGV